MAGLENARWARGGACGAASKKRVRRGTVCTDQDPKILLPLPTYFNHGRPQDPRTKKKKSFVSCIGRESNPGLAETVL
jgi:hypothetical protein